MSTTTLRILVSGVHDGLGGIHQAGDVVALPADVAQIFIDRKCGVLLDEDEAGDARAKAKAAAAERVDEQRMAEQKAHAEAAMRRYDNVPEDVKAAAREHGDDVIIEYMNEQIAAEQAKKAKPVAMELPSDVASESGEADGFEAIEQLDADAAPKKKRGRPRKNPL